MTAITIVNGIAMPPLLTGLSAIADRYDGFLLDLWGTVHDGAAPFPGVLDCLDRLKKAGKRICILSNAPRRVTSVIKRLEEMGVPSDLYDHVMSSGEASHRALVTRNDPWHAALGRRCYHMGPARDNDVWECTGFDMVADVAQADFILATGIEEWDETVADHEAELAAGAARGLPMLCANPDLTVVVQGRTSVCAGAMAARYQELGGDVFYHGKPHPSVYAACFELLGIADPRRVLAVGDSLRTDVAGALAVGADAVLVTGGIHAEEFGLAPGETPNMERLLPVFAQSGQVPTAVMPGLVW